MTKTFDTSSSNTIHSKSTLNSVEVNNTNQVLTEEELREVVKKGYLLNNIALTSIPRIIQEAIDAASLETKDLVLADQILKDLRDDIGRLETGIYNKQYIDNKLTYLEQILSSKASSDSVAQIADARITLAKVDFATTAQVNSLVSRVDNSESSISNLQETVNTKDSARASQINEAIAQVNDTLSNYSEAINLTVDEFGNVKAQKIEDLNIKIDSTKGQLEASIEETNELVATVDGNWKAQSIKLITGVDGSITGYSFVNGSGLTSNFTINANSFKISDSTNSYTPFSIENGQIKFNGRVEFSNNVNVPDYALNSIIREDIDLINASISQNEIDKANLDEKIDNEEEARINAINAEQQARADAILERIQEESRLDGKIDTKEQELINHANTLSDAQANYTDTVKQALIDGEISQAEQNAINVAQAKVNVAKQELNATISNLTKVESIDWQTEVQGVLDGENTVVDGGKVAVSDLFISNINGTGNLTIGDALAQTGVYATKNFIKIKENGVVRVQIGNLNL